MRFSPHDLRQGILDPRYRPTPKPRDTSGGPLDTTGTLQAAVHVLHSAGADAARARIERTVSAGGYLKPRNAWAAPRVREYFQVYSHLIGDDVRTTVKGQARARVGVSGDSVPAGYEVVVQAPGGYIGRTCVWSPTPRPFDASELSVIAYPVLLALVEEFGGTDDQLAFDFAEVYPTLSVLGVEVVEIAHQRKTEVSAEQALAGGNALHELLQRLRAASATRPAPPARNRTR